MNGFSCARPPTLWLDRFLYLGSGPLLFVKGHPSFLESQGQKYSNHPRGIQPHIVARQSVRRIQYTLTMEEPGVSKFVAVRLADLETVG